MDIEYLADISHIREAFQNHFVLSWDRFQAKNNAWISEMAKQNYVIDRQWYEHSYMWDRMDPTYPGASMKEALNFLRQHTGQVFFLAEKGECAYDQGVKTIDFIAKADAHQLADRIELEWYESYRLAEQDRAIPDALPEDLYVFDLSMRWCVVFTHETTDWEAENVGEWRKVAQTRYCIIDDRKS